MKNYRKIYEEALGIKIPEGHEIHHIDFDRNNNTIKNLISLPKELHQRYHSILKEVYKIELGIQTQIPSLLQTGRGWSVKDMGHTLIEFGEIIEEIWHWVNTKENYVSIGVLPMKHDYIKI